LPDLLKDEIKKQEEYNKSNAQSKYFENQLNIKLLDVLDSVSYEAYEIIDPNEYSKLLRNYYEKICNLVGSFNNRTFSNPDVIVDTYYSVYFANKVINCLYLMNDVGVYLDRNKSDFLQKGVRHYIVKQYGSIAPNYNIEYPIPKGLFQQDVEYEIHYEIFVKPTGEYKSILKYVVVMDHRKR
jgi:hypothetical protein